MKVAATLSCVVGLAAAGGGGLSGGYAAGGYGGGYGGGYASGGYGGGYGIGGYGDIGGSQASRYAALAVESSSAAQNIGAYDTFAFAPGM